MFIEAYLILSKLDSHHDTNAELDAYEAQKEVTSNAKDMLDLISHLRRKYRRIHLQYLSNKIELAGQLVN